MREGATTLPEMFLGKKFPQGWLTGWWSTLEV